MSQSSATEYDPEFGSYFEAHDPDSSHSDSNGPLDHSAIHSPSSLKELVTRTLDGISWLRLRSEEDLYVDNQDELLPLTDSVLLFIYSVAGGQFLGHNSDHYTRCISSILDINILSKFMCALGRREMKSSKDSDENSLKTMIQNRLKCAFAAMGKLISVVASGRLLCIDDELPQGLEAIRRDESLVVASQLPRELSKFPDVLVSSHASPAVKRLALSILFGIVVLRESLIDCNPWESSRFQPCHLLICLQTYVNDLVCHLQECDTSPHMSSVNRVTYAMVWCLYAVTDSAVSRLPGESAFRPHTMAVLLNLLNAVLHPDGPDNDLYIKEPDVAQRIVMRCGNAILWSWKHWDDGRILDSDRIVKLTANWLCHGAERIFESIEPNVVWNKSAKEDSEFNRVRKIILQDSPAARTAIFKQVKHLSCTFNENEEAFDDLRLIHIHRIIQLLKELLVTTESTHYEERADWSRMAADLLLILRSLDFSEAALSAKCGVLQVLDGIDKQTLLWAFHMVEQNVGKAFSVRLEEEIRNLPRHLDVSGGPRSGKGELSPCSARKIIIGLDLVALICSSGSTMCLTSLVVSVLSGLIDAVNTGVLSSSYFFYVSDVRTALLSCLNSFEVLHRKTGGRIHEKSNVRVHKLWDDEAVLSLALDSDRTHLPISSALVTYLNTITPQALEEDALLCAETWDYLRDVLLLTLPQKFKLRDNQTQHRLMSVCKGMEHVLQRANRDAACFITASPLTISLIDTLQSTVAAGGDGELKNVVQEELVSACRSLLKTIKPSYNEMENNARMSRKADVSSGIQK